MGHIHELNTNIVLFMQQVGIVGCLENILAVDNLDELLLDKSQ